MNLTRRNFIKAGLIISAGMTGLKYFINLNKQTTSLYGALKKDPLGVLDLPEGFSYKIISEVGKIMDDGFLVPGAIDGMGVFAGGNGISIIIRNHENTISCANVRNWKKI